MTPFASVSGTFQGLEKMCSQAYSHPKCFRAEDPKACMSVCVGNMSRGSLEEATEDGAASQGCSQDPMELLMENFRCGFFSLGRGAPFQFQFSEQTKLGVHMLHHVQLRSFCCFNNLPSPSVTQQDKAPLCPESP